MIQEYLDKASKLFSFDINKLNNNLPLESILVEFDDENTEVEISQKYDPKEKTYSVFGTIAYSDRLFDPDSKLEAINNFFIENQETINNCIGRVLNKRGIYAEPSEKGLFLGNGRSISTNGLWFIYHTNHYDFHEETKFKDLVQEEMGTITDSFEAIYGLILYVIDNNPSEKDIEGILKDQKSVEFKESELVKDYVNKEVTEKMNGSFFSAVGKIVKAEEKVQKSYVDDAMKEKNCRIVD